MMIWAYEKVRVYKRIKPGHPRLRPGAIPDPLPPSTIRLYYVSSLFHYASSIPSFPVLAVLCSYSDRFDFTLHLCLQFHINR